MMPSTGYQDDNVTTTPPSPSPPSQSTLTNADDISAGMSTTTNTNNDSGNSDNANTNTLNDNDDEGTTSRTGTPPLQLRKNLGLISCVSYVAGGIIGVGIFVSPQAVLQHAGNSVGVALCVWLFCAFVTFCGALCYAELGTRIRKSGGSYTYVRAAFGDVLGFVFLWTQLIVVRPTACALGALAAAEYTLRPLFLDCPDRIPTPAKQMLALCILGLLVFLNSLSTKWGAGIQTLSTVCKVSALLVISSIGIFFIVRDGISEDLRDPFASHHQSVKGITLAIYSCTYAYTGWDNLTMATEEVKNSQRNIPLATLLAVALTAVLYLLANVSYHAVLTVPQIVSGVAVAAVFTEMTVPPLMWVLVPCIAVSAMGIVNVIIFTSVRVNFIGGRDGLFPEFLSMINVSRKTPLVSLLVLSLLASIVVLLADDISYVLGAYSLFRASGETLAILGMFRLRRKYPATHSTYVAPTIFPILYLVINISLATFAISLNTSRFIVPLLLTLCGLPVYFLSTSSALKRGPLEKINDVFVRISRRLLLSEFASKIY